MQHQVRRVRTWLGSRDRGDWALVAIVVAGGLLRVVYVVLQSGDYVGGDGDGYYVSALALADGHGFVSGFMFPFTGNTTIAAAADHPPAWITLLAVPALLGFQQKVYFQVTAALVGTATVAAVGLTGRRIGGRRVGLIAAAIAAFYPNLWMYERVLQCETLAILLGTLCIYTAYGFWQRPSLRGAAAMGLFTGLLTMTRPESGLLLGLLVLPAIALQRTVPLASRLRWFGVAAGIVVLQIVPWAAYNTARFDEPVILSTNLGQTLTAANCDEVYDGRYVGFWSYACLGEATVAVVDEGDASSRDVAMQDMAFDYIGDHADRLPPVILAREGRTWGLYQPFFQLRLDSLGGPTTTVSRPGLYMYWVLCLLAVAGGVVLRRRRLPVFPQVAFVALVAVATALSIGQTRYRALAEVTLVLLASVALDAALEAIRRRRASVALPTEEILRAQLSLDEELPSEATNPPSGDAQCLQSPSTTS